MRYICLLLFAFVITTSTASENYNPDDFNFELAIDSTDTVYFDLSKARISGNQLILPVNIMTDEPVNSLDFSLRYDFAELDYDTITNLTTYLQGLCYQNMADSAVRYTSSSLTAIGVGVNLVEVKFNLLGLQISNLDFHDVKGYLNGIKCSAYIINQLTVGIKENAAELYVDVYPNPVINELTLVSKKDQTLNLFDASGRLLIQDIALIQNEKTTLDLSGLDNGIYFLKSDLLQSSAVRVVVRH